MRSPVALLLLAALPAAELVAQTPESPEPAETPDARDPGTPWRTSYFPYVAGGANDGPVLAFKLRYWQPAEYEDRVTANAALNAEAGITPRGGRHAYVNFTAPQLWHGWRVNALAGAKREVRFGYFGLGNDTEFNDNAITGDTPFFYRVRRTRYRGQIEVSRQIGPQLQLALLGDVEEAHFTSLPEGSLFRSDFGLELNQTDVSSRLALVYDTRDNEFNTHQGLLLEVGTQLASGGSGYTRLYSILRGYLAIREGTVAAARLGFSGMGGGPTLDARYTIPAWEKEIAVLGGQYSHRSLDTGRLAGKHVMFGNLEVRHDLLALGDLGAITLLGFVDAGRVFEQESFKLTTDGVKVGGGGGVGLRILRSTIFTFNFAGGPDGFNYSVGSGWMF